MNFDNLQKTLLYACETAISQFAVTVKMQSPASENHLEKGLENTTEKHQKSDEKLPRSAVLRYEWKSADFY